MPTALRPQPRTTVDLIRRQGERFFLRKCTFISERAVVTTPPSQDPDKLNRIKCWFKGLEDDNHNPGETDWVKPLGIGQGDECGIYFPPRIGDQVYLWAVDGNPLRLYYMSCNTTGHPPPFENIKGEDPSKRWLIKTFGGHYLKLYDDPTEQRIQLLSIKNAYLLINDTDEYVEIIDHDGNQFLMSKRDKKVEIKTIAGHFLRFRNGDTKDITLKHGVKDSWLWLQENGDVRLHAEEKLHLEAKHIIEHPTEIKTTYVPPTTYTCISDGIDYITCNATRQRICWDCDSGEETGESPPGTDPNLQYEHFQTTPSSVWEVKHKKNKIPQITVLDDDGHEVDAGIQHVDKNIALISFASPQTGAAYCD